MIGIFFTFFEKVIIPIIAAFIGGWLGHRAAIKSTQIAHDNNEKLQRQKEESEISAYLQAIHTELTSIKSDNEANISKMLNDEESYLSKSMSHTQDYFTVYNSTCHLIGTVDKSTRDSIITTYNRLKSFIDTLQLNEKILHKYLEFEEKSHNKKSECYNYYKGRMNDRLIELQRFKEEELKPEYDELLESLNSTILEIEQNKYFKS